MSCTLGRNDQYPLENFKRGARVWIKDSDKVWTCGELTQDLTFAGTNAEVHLLDENGEELIRSYDVIANGLPFPCNPEILIGANNLTTLSYLHEPAVLHNLKHRFVERRAIYTYCGIVLVAINPYADCAHLYSDDVIQVYRSERDDIRKLDPHIYAIAEEAYVDLCEYGKNQSVIISGESGAGKTVSAKFVMRYLTSVANTGRAMSTAGGHGSTGGDKIEDRVLASNPIMEAIGNAKTIRNDNSSRFGKFIQMNFGAAKRPTARPRGGSRAPLPAPTIGNALLVSGAEMKTYLLEKSRVVFRSADERNYHVFYQMCAAATAGDQLPNVLDGLMLMTASDYDYLRAGSGRSFHRIEDVDDAAEFAGLLRAFDTLNVSADDQRNIFRVLAGILCLGNVRFESDAGGTAHIQDANQQFVDRICSELYGIDRTALTCWLTTREIRAGGDVVMKALTIEEASINRDALAKVLYACLFDWIVKKINENLSYFETLADGQKSRNGDELNAKFIGVLDIYGFETFERNSFEQFCINYANEKLQQQFNQHVFKLEQAEYEREQIAWDVIDFDDNQLCINLIEGRPGIIDYLDEQCKTGRGTDADWLERMRTCKTLADTKRLRMPRIHDSSFIVRHFASDVAYHVDGFLEKNKDTVNEQLLNIIGKTTWPFLHDIIRDVLASSSTGVRRKRTVAVQFRDSLSRLISLLSTTRPHYVRCIKPNDRKKSFYFDAKRSIQQLRANGVLETVRISAAGFPSRWTYEVFASRYSLLLPLQQRCALQPRNFASVLCSRVLERGKFALGQTKIFLRTGQVACIERLRNERRYEAATSIQTFIKGAICRRRYVKMRAAVHHLQVVTRAAIIYRRMHYLRIYRAACCVQSFFADVVRRRRRDRILAAILQLQAHYRAGVVRRRVAEEKYLRAVTVIQRTWRAYFARRKQILFKRRVVLVQCCVRRFLARRALRHLKAEARLVSHWQNLNRGLENKVISLSQRLDLVMTERTAAVQRGAELAAAEQKLRVAGAKVVGAAKLELQALRESMCKMHESSAADTQASLTVIGQLRRAIADALKERDDALRNSPAKDKQIAELHTELAERDGVQAELQRKLDAETSKTKALERDLEHTRAQLLENVALLASPNLSRVGSFRSDCRTISAIVLDSTSTGYSFQPPLSAMSTDGERLLAEQQLVISDMRTRLDKFERTISRLKLLAGTKILNRVTDEISANGIYESMKIQDFELTIAKNKADIQRLAEGGDMKREFMMILERAWEENERLRDETRHIRAILAKMFERQTRPTANGQPPATATPFSPTADSGCVSGSGSEDGLAGAALDRYAEAEMEERMELERYVRHYRLLLDSASRELAERDDRILQLESQLSLVHAADETIINETGLSDEHNSISASDHQSTSASGGSLPAFSSLVRENLSLQRKYNRRSDELAEARAYLRGYSTAIDSTATADHDEGNKDGMGASDVQRLAILKHDGAAKHSAMIEVFNVPEFTRLLIQDMRPRIAKRLMPGLSAYLLLMAFRYYDQKSDDIGLTNLFNALLNELRDPSMTGADMDVLALWLVNVWRLLNLLRQYSDDDDCAVAEWHSRNTDAQRSHVIRHFDLEPLRNALHQRVQAFYANLMKLTIEPLLTPKIVPAILLHESDEFRQAAANVSASGRQPGSTTLADEAADGVKSRRSALADLLEFMNIVLLRLNAYSADAIVIAQVFRQIAKWIVALALNNMMFRRDLCTPDKAISIKHNITQVQCWMAERRIGGGAAEMAPIFEPLIQASHLLQLRKSAANLDVLCAETTRLRPKQILAILRHFTPSTDCRFEEDVVDERFLALVEQRLAERQANGYEGDGQVGQDEDELLMRGTYAEPFDTRSFFYSDVALEAISLPAALNFQAVLRLV